ncbi:MAG TPA: NADH-quinone oxidoreductase subunit L [Desulfuromonas sp.]|nr:NADH-quinone oxidoreductase subunit L [Desulfuromonas sp.]
MNDLLLFTIPLAPLLFGVVNALCGIRLPTVVVQTFAVCGVAISAAMVLLLWPLATGEGTQVILYTWAESGTLQVPVTILFDRLAAPMALMVSGVSTLIHLYAIGYMKAERDQARFFALLNLFVFAMLCIVLADNLLLLFLGWEGVGFCSYALIGYWYGEEKTAAAGRKAFLVTRVGDVFLGLALLWLFAATGTLSLSAINAQAAALPAATVTAIGLLLLLGACGKSAQLPLMTWLPDAMAGPTPVSALIHAATMVTAGVYLLCRFFPLIALSPTALAAIAGVGAATALYAATCAAAQQEIKRVLAYSTMSQVGFMFLAVGAGAMSAAMFHLFTHAFFKAALFMGAGCVIHLADGENSIFNLGGMKQRSPYLFWIFCAAALCLAGAPLTGGFFSKDAIFAALAGHGGWFHLGLLGIASYTALLTAFYTFRLLYLVFAGSGASETKGHHLPVLMLWPLLPLTVLGLLGGLLNLPPIFGGGSWLANWLGATASHLPAAQEWGLALLSLLLVLSGWLLARWRYRNYRAGAMEGRLPEFLRLGWHADSLVEKLVLRPYRYLARFSSDGIDRSAIDGALDLFAKAILAWGEYLRLVVSGRVSHYLGGVAWGLLLVLGWLLLTTVG